MCFVFEFYPEYGAEPDFGPFFTSLRISAENAEQAKNAYSNPRAKENEYGD
jgi:hypothetical protein